MAAAPCARNWSPLFSVKGGTAPSQGIAIGASDGGGGGCKEGVGRHCAGGIAAEEGRWGRIGEAPVVGPQGEDASGSRLACAHSRVILREAVGGQVLMVGRVKRGGLAREDVDEDIMRSAGGGGGRRSRGSRDARTCRV